MNLLTFDTNHPNQISPADGNASFGMNDTLDEIICLFATSGPDVRMQLLLDYAERLGPLPPALHAQRMRGHNRIEECMTPVFLWIRQLDGRLQVHGDAPRETPVVRGMMTVIIESLNGKPIVHGSEFPCDLLERMKLHPIIGVRRQQGLRGLIEHVRKRCRSLEGD